MLRDPGTFWHTVVGQRMLQTGELVRTDPFSFTRYGEPWIAHQWLGECAMAIVHRWAGLDGLLVAAVTLLAATYARLAGRLLRAGLTWPAAALLIVLVIAASSYHFHPRPHLITIALLAWTFGRLSDVEAGRLPPRALLILPVVFILWTNVHGGALSGIGTTLVVLAAWLVRKVRLAGRRRHSPPSVAAPMIGWVAGLSALAVLVNPYGTALPRVWFSLAGSRVLPKLIVEHAPLQLLSVEAVMIGALAAVYLVMLASTWYHVRQAVPGLERVAFRVTWLLPLLWLAMSLMRVRHGPLFAVTAAVSIADMLPHSPWAVWLANRGSPWVIPARQTVTFDPRAAVIPVVLVVLALILQTAGVRCPVIGAGWARLRADYWPIQATDALREHLASAEANPRVFNDMRFGGYLIYHVPEVRVYIDDRCELYGDSFLWHYVAVQENPQLIEQVALDRDIEMALVRTRSRLDRYLARSPGWRRLCQDLAASLYRRTITGTGDVDR